MTVINRNDQFYCYSRIYISARISNIKFVWDFTWDELAMKRTYQILCMVSYNTVIIYIAVKFRYQCNCPVASIAIILHSQLQCMNHPKWNGIQVWKTNTHQMSIPFTIAACESVAFPCAWLLCSIVILACIRVCMCERYNASMHVGIGRMPISSEAKSE